LPGRPATMCGPAPGRRDTLRLTCRFLGVDTSETRVAGWWWVRFRPRWATPSQVSLVEITARTCENLAGVVSLGLAHDNNGSLLLR
jgi:hypothetical protein